jgi:hypothetical protein
MSGTVACRPSEAILRFRGLFPPLRRFATSALRATALLLPLGHFACGDDNGSPGPLPAKPELLDPASGAVLTTDTPSFVIQNAQGYDEGQAAYTIRVAVASTDREVATLTVNAGKGRTTAQFAGPLLRGATLAWRATGRATSGAEVQSDSSTFRLPPVECVATSDPYAKSVTDYWLPACTLAHNIYNNPQEVLGPPNASGHGPASFFGFMSLGDGGYVSVDMQACTVDRPGPDVRVFQSVSSEPVTLYASSHGTGPWVLLAARIPCGNRLPGAPSNYCDFDLKDAGLEETRYYKVEDGELYPCPGGTVTEGADIDAVQILSLKP